MNRAKRIGIFEYDRLMDSFIKDLAVKFAEVGYAVDLFYKGVEVGTNIANVGELDNYENIRFFDFTTHTTRSQMLARQFKRLLNVVALRFSLKLDDSPESIIEPKVLQSSKGIVDASQYLCFIGIEKKGLIWAGMLSQQYPWPLIYYSLELYIEKHPQIDVFYHLRKAEKRYHQLSVATIIQDKPRSDVLLKANEIQTTNTLYFPVSVRGDPIKEKSDYLYVKLGIDKNKKILLYFGTLYGTRFTTQIVEAAKNLTDDMVLVLHGFVFGLMAANYIKYLQSIADKQKVFFSLNLVPENEIVKVISSAHIGLALYTDTNPNDGLTAFSSAKMAYYSQCGIPVIAFETGSFNELMAHHKCGELIHSISEIPQKTTLIMENYIGYRQQAFMAFEKFYNFDKNFAEFLLHFKEVSFRSQGHDVMGMT